MILYRVTAVAILTHFVQMRRYRQISGDLHSTSPVDWYNIRMVKPNQTADLVTLYHVDITKNTTSLQYYNYFLLTLQQSNRRKGAISTDLLNDKYNYPRKLACAIGSLTKPPQVSPIWHANMYKHRFVLSCSSPSKASIHAGTNRCDSRTQNLPI